MNMDLELILSFPPTVNSYYCRARNGSGVFISKKGRLYRDRIAAEIREQTSLLNSEFPLDIVLIVEVTLHMPDKRKRDLDNYMKALLDAITKTGLWEDDSLIDQLFIYRGAVIKGGLAKVNIGQAGPVIRL